MSEAAAPYQYIVLHQSCRNHPGVAAVQAAHAAAESVQAVPVSSDTHVCVLMADTSAELSALAIRIMDVGLHCVLVREPDAPYFGAPVALGVEPTDRERVRPLLSHLQVFR